MNFIGIIWIIVIVIWVINRANNASTNAHGRKITYTNQNTQSRPTRTNTTNVRSNNYTTSDRNAVSNELKKTTADSIENVKTLYESGIISKEEYREYKQRLR